MRICEGERKKRKCLRHRMGVIKLFTISSVTLGGGGKSLGSAMSPGNKKTKGCPALSTQGRTVFPWKGLTTQEGKLQEEV